MKLDLSVFERFAVTYQPGDIIFCEYEPGDSFYLIQSGQVKIVKIFGNIEKTVDILNPGEFFGEMALLEEAPRSASIIAVEQCKLLEFNKTNFEILMKGNPQMALKLLRLFAKRIYDQKRRFMILTLDELDAKIMDVFIMLFDNGNYISEDKDTSGKVIFNNSIDDIAHWAGISPDKCQPVLHNLSTQRKIEIDGDRIIIKNINEFRRQVDSKRKRQEAVEE
ncbi:MAG: Crp/Fnr family transcriptional regulator [Deltaproteobacteria bacterium]|nr:Crp/Fnr family transcriptional regulator [Deltaproteobacteria bacterium]